MLYWRRWKKICSVLAFVASRVRMRQLCRKLPNSSSVIFDFTSFVKCWQVHENSRGHGDSLSCGVGYADGIKAHLLLWLLFSRWGRNCILTWIFLSLNFSKNMHKINPLTEKKLLFCFVVYTKVKRLSGELTKNCYWQKQKLSVRRRQDFSLNAIIIL